MLWLYKTASHKLLRNSIWYWKWNNLFSLFGPHFWKQALLQGLERLTLFRNFRHIYHNPIVIYMHAEFHISLPSGHVPTMHVRRRDTSEILRTNICWQFKIMKLQYYSVPIWITGVIYTCFMLSFEVHILTLIWTQFLRFIIWAFRKESLIMNLPPSFGDKAFQVCGQLSASHSCRYWLTDWFID